MKMEKSCKNCTRNFKITESDLGFYKKIDVPPPTHCPDCRLQRRLAFRNERTLFQRKCDLCKKEIISFFKAGTEFPVYCNECWWSDKWDPLAYGRDFDFNRPFFEQFKELLKVVPQINLLQLANENSPYNSFLAYSKNTHMSPGSYFVEDCYYLRKSEYCKDCLNSQCLDHCELLSFSSNCKNCYGSNNLLNCRNCSESGFLADCSGCQSCFMCSGLANKKFHYKNKAYKEEDYKKIVTEKMREPTESLMREFQEFNQTIAKKYQNQINCENSSGDYIQNCKNAEECYDCFDVEDSKYLIESVKVKDSMDLTQHDKDINLCYEMASGGDSNYNSKFCFCTCASPNSEYLYACFYLTDSFGCTGFHGKQTNCILNKKYSASEYAALRARIIEHMKKTGDSAGQSEYGEFFPISISPTPYNNSAANDCFPLSREEALAKKYSWEDKDPAQYKAPTAVLGQGAYGATASGAAVGDVPDSILKEILACEYVRPGTAEKCGKNYRIISQELNLSRKMNQPLSHFCADCRQISLQSLKNPRKLWDRKCDKCGVEIKSTYAAGGREKVYCEKCYLAEIY